MYEEGQNGCAKTSQRDETKVRKKSSPIKLIIPPAAQQTSGFTSSTPSSAVSSASLPTARPETPRERYIRKQLRKHTFGRVKHFVANRQPILSSGRTVGSVSSGHHTKRALTRLKSRSTPSTPRATAGGSSPVLAATPRTAAWNALPLDPKALERSTSGTKLLSLSPPANAVSGPASLAPMASANSKSANASPINAKKLSQLPHPPHPLFHSSSSSSLISLNRPRPPRLGSTGSSRSSSRDDAPSSLQQQQQLLVQSCASSELQWRTRVWLQLTSLAEQQHLADERLLGGGGESSLHSQQPSSLSEAESEEPSSLQSPRNKRMSNIVRARNGKVVTLQLCHVCRPTCSYQRNLKYIGARENLDQVLWYRYLGR